MEASSVTGAVSRCLSGSYHGLTRRGFCEYMRKMSAFVGVVQLSLRFKIDLFNNFCADANDLVKTGISAQAKGSI